MKESSLFIQLSSVQSLVVSDSLWPHGLQHARPPSVQSSHSVVSDSLRPHESQHARPPCPSPTPGLTQIHIHRVRDAIQPSHPLSSPSPPSPNPSQHQSLFQRVNSSHEVAKVSAGVSALASFLPRKSQGWSPSEWTGWISLQWYPLFHSWFGRFVSSFYFCLCC